MGCPFGCGGLLIDLGLDGTLDGALLFKDAPPPAERTDAAAAAAANAGGAAGTAAGTVEGVGVPPLGGELVLREQTLAARRFGAPPHLACYALQRARAGGAVPRGVLRVLPARLQGVACHVHVLVQPDEADAARLLAALTQLKQRQARHGASASPDPPQTFLNRPQTDTKPTPDRAQFSLDLGFCILI